MACKVGDVPENKNISLCFDLLQNSPNYNVLNVPSNKENAELLVSLKPDAHG